jgi:hypothetical protein
VSRSLSAPAAPQTIISPLLDLRCTGLGTTESAGGRHTGTPRAIWHANVHGPRRLMTLMGATDQRHGCEGHRSTAHLRGSAQQASRGVPRIPSCSPLGNFAHYACYNFSSTGNDMAKDMPPGPGRVRWPSRRASPLPHFTFTVRSPFPPSRTRLGVTAGRQSCRIAACREPGGNTSREFERLQARRVQRAAVL